MSKIKELLAEVRKEVGLSEEKKEKFVSPEAANAAMDAFMTEINDLASSQDSVVRVREKQRKVTDKSWDLKFEVVFDLENDPFVKGKTYKDGEAYIYISDAFYKKMDELGLQNFGEKPGWNNTASIGWFMGTMDKKG